jgi:AcrR family transcriptional regulator
VPRPRLLPSDEELLRLRDEDGLTYAQIAARFDVTKGAVFLRFRDAGATKRPTRYAAAIPWRVRTEHDKERPVVMLRFWARMQARDSKLDEASHRRVEKWAADLRDRDLVVMYDESIPPNPASRRGGFAYVPRRDGIDTFPVSNPDVPREQPAAVRCALCDANQDLELVEVALSAGSLTAPICGTHRTMLLAAGQRTGRLGLVWAC